MSAESEIYSTLSGDVDVAALVGVRIYPDMIEQGADVPAIAYSRASTDLEQTIGGAIITTTTTMVLTCLDDGKAGAEDLADKVVSALQTAGMVVVGRSGSYSPDVLLYESTITVEHTEE